MDSSSRPEAVTHPDNIRNMARTFNVLPRADWKSKWMISIRHLDSKHSLVFLVNTHSDHFLNDAPCDVEVSLHGKMGTELASMLVPILIPAFLNGVGSKESTPFAPWSWSTPEEDLSKVLEQFRVAGVRNELCTVGVGSAAECSMSGKLWKEWCSKYTFGTCCAKCKEGEQKNMEQWRLCEGCLAVRYCS